MNFTVPSVSSEREKSVIAVFSQVVCLFFQSKLESFDSCEKVTPTAAATVQVFFGGTKVAAQPPSQRIGLWMSWIGATAGHPSRRKETFTERPVLCLRSRPRESTNGRITLTFALISVALERRVRNVGK